MIILRSERGDIYNLFTKPKHVIGRNGNLELDGDKSVSRQHAAIYVTVIDKKIHIKLQDLGSKYGTFVIVNDSNKEIPKNSETTVKIGDKIKFGMQWNTWTIEQSQLVICASMLSAPQKKSLTSLLKSVNGIVVSDWNDKCSYLTVNEIQSITTNVFQALGRVKPIVTLEYWNVLVDVLNSIDEEPLPDCDDYCPPIQEPNLKSKSVDLSMNNNRRRLFNNMKFVACTTTQYNRILLVEHAGGTPVDGTRTVFKEEELEKENILVMETDTINKRNVNLAKLLKFLEKRKLRRIAEKEIGMSLILNSTDLYCNPNHEPEFIDQQSESQIIIKDEEEDDASVLDLETQDLDEESSTQFFNTDSNKFSLAINDKCDDDDEDVQIIYDTPEDNEPVVKGPPAKKKRTDSSDQSNSKSIKITDWVTRKPATKPNIPIKSPPRVVENFKKPTKNLFAFNPERKPAARCTDSLFKTSSSSPSSLDTTDKTEKRKRTSVELFSSETAAPPAKKANVDVKSLFQTPSTSKRTRTGSLILFESDSTDSASQKSSRVKATNETSNKENAPFVVPKKDPALQLVDSSKDKLKIPKKEIEEESDDMSFDTKDMFNQSIVLTLSLIKSNSQQRQSLNTTNGSAVNFKKFKKNNGINHTRVIPTNDLVEYTCKLNLNGDHESSGHSDSD